MKRNWNGKRFEHEQHVAVKTNRIKHMNTQPQQTVCIGVGDDKQN